LQSGSCDQTANEAKAGTLNALGYFHSSTTITY
jgi:hypothetical protein